MRECNHWFRLLPDEELMFAEAAYRGCKMDREHSVELLAALFREDCPHELAMIAQEAYRGIYFETEQRNNHKTEAQKKYEAIWDRAKQGHKFPENGDVFKYRPYEFRAAIDYRDSVDSATFDALCFGLYVNFETDYLTVEDCYAEIYYEHQRLNALDFEGLKRELLKIEADIKKVIGPSPDWYFSNKCRNRNRFDRKLINLFERRKSVLNRMLLKTDDEKRRFTALDEMLHDMTKKMYRRTANLYRSTIANGDEAYDYNVDGWISYDIYFDDEELGTKVLDSDDVYGSDFKYMMMSAFCQMGLTAEPQIVSCIIGHEKEHTPDVTDEELDMVDPFDGEDWHATHYVQHPLCDHHICYATHRLMDRSLLSVPDILRIGWFEVESQITSQYMRKPDIGQ